jgi:hypothetical protein
VIIVSVKPGQPQPGHQGLRELHPLKRLIAYSGPMRIARRPSRYERGVRRFSHASPVGSLDLAAFGRGGPYEIWPCPECAPWHAEVIAGDDGYIAIRVWHSIDCPNFRSLTPNPERER